MDSIDKLVKIGGIKKSLGNKYKLEVLNISAIQNGIEVFFKAWDKNDNQFSFGPLGDVEIERLRIINPYTLVPDGTKSIHISKLGDETLIDNNRDDPKQALIDEIEHALRVKKEKFMGLPFITGKVGNTTTTVNPQTGNGGGNTTTDDYCYLFNSGGTTWATIHDSAGDSVDLNELQGQTQINVGATTSNWRYILRPIMTFDTSAVGTDSISSATLSLYGVARADTTGINPSINVYASTPASNNAVAGTDYQQVGTTAFSTKIIFDNYVTSNYNDFVLNASGISNINKTGVSKFSAREAEYDAPDIEPSPSTFNNNSRFVFNFADAGSNKPKLVIEHAAAATATHNFTLLGVGT